MGKRLNFPSHLHGELELFLVQSGCVCVGIDGEFRELKAGELAVVFPNTVHSYQCREADSRYMMAVCGTSLLGDYFPSLTQCRPRRPYLCGKALDPDVLYALHSLYRCRCTGADSSISRALLHLILAHVLPELSLEPAPEPKAMDLTSSVVRYIMRNFRQPLSLEHIAKELGVSKYHLSHVFSARLHTSFREYVNALRLDCARDLLAATELSMLEGAWNPASTACGRSTVCSGTVPADASQYRKAAPALWGAQDGSAQRHNALCACNHGFGSLTGCFSALAPERKLCYCE
ncbi:MAG: helix-turn-helix domain-containing protein [Ruthenibacterium lactatiformans]